MIVFQTIPGEIVAKVRRRANNGRNDDETAAQPRIAQKADKDIRNALTSPHSFYALFFSAHHILNRHSYV
jgi:hypothetical protein